MYLLTRQSHHQAESCPKRCEIIGVRSPIIIEVEVRGWPGRNAEETPERCEIDGVHDAIAIGVTKKAKQAVARRTNQNIIIADDAVAVAVEWLAVGADLGSQRRQRVATVSER